MGIVARSLAPFMMVGDDQFNAAAAEGFGFFNCGDAAIDAYDELRASVGELAQRFGIQAVTFFESFGDVVIHLAAEQRDGAPEDGGGGDAVDVVVAVDDDFFAGFDGEVDPLGGADDAGEEGGLMEMMETRS